MQQTELPQATQQPESAPPTSAPGDAPARKKLSAWLGRPLRWLWVLVKCVAQFLLIAWATLAIYFSNLPWAWGRLLLALAFAAFGVWALWITRRRRMGWAFAGGFSAVFIWFASIRPSHERPWRPEVAVLPRAIIDGDRVRFTGYRNFDYRTRDDFTIRYEEREVYVSQLRSVDLFISYWKPGPVGHTFLSFNFDEGPPLCISIETRTEAGESFAPLASMFKQFELIYVVGDERDIVRSRTNYRGEEVYMYRILASPEGVQRLFRIYCQRINELAERPEFYHLLKNSCTVNIVRYANQAGRLGKWNIRHLLNGLIDRYMYSTGAVDRTLPFDELRRLSRINEVAQAADDHPDFSQRIRAALPIQNPQSKNQIERNVYALHYSR